MAAIFTFSHIHVGIYEECHHIVNVYIILL